MLLHNERLEYLAWDSDLFNKKIGRVFVDKSSDLEEILSNAQRSNYQLIYVFGSKDFFVENNILAWFNGCLTDRKVLYEKRVIKAKENPSFISEYKSNKIIAELELLAYESGKHSRFKLDKNFQENDFYRMYKIWIENSINKQIADNVFVVKDNEVVKGFVTLKIDSEKGYIGLIAVSPDVQGKNYGKALINVCENELLSNNVFKLEVSTQANNIQACKFYEKCNFQIKEINNIYHFWL